MALSYFRTYYFRICAGAHGCIWREKPSVTFWYLLAAQFFGNFEEVDEAGTEIYLGELHSTMDARTQAFAMSRCAALGLLRKTSDSSFVLLDPKTGRDLPIRFKTEADGNMTTLQIIERPLFKPGLSKLEAKVWAYLSIAVNRMTNEELADALGVSETHLKGALKTLKAERLVKCKVEPISALSQKRISGVQREVRKEFQKAGRTRMRTIEILNPDGSGEKLDPRYKKERRLTWDELTVELWEDSAREEALSRVLKEFGISLHRTEFYAPEKDFWTATYTNDQRHPFKFYKKGLYWFRHTNRYKQHRGTIFALADEHGLGDAELIALIKSKVKEVHDEKHPKPEPSPPPVERSLAEVMEGL